MSEGVRAGGSGQFWRQPDGELGVEDDQFGQQFGMKEDRFPMRRFERDDRTAADFASGAGRGRDGDERRQPRPIGLVIKPGEFQSGPFHQQARGLADIQRTAPANGNDGIAAILAKPGHGLAHVVFCGISVNLGIDEPVLALCCFTQNRDETQEGYCIHQSGIRNHQWPPYAQSLGSSRQLGQSTGAE